MPATCPLNTIERFTIDATGNLVGGTTLSLTMPVGLGDQAAAVINGWLYIAGGSTTARGAAQINTDLVARAQLLPNGEAEGAGWELLPNLPLPTAGGRMVGGMCPGDPQEAQLPLLHRRQYRSGPDRRDQNLYFLAIDNGSPGSHRSGPGLPADGPGWDYSRDSVGNIIQTARQRELFGAVISNGYLFLIGGFNKTLLATTVYTSVERAPILRTARSDIHRDGPPAHADQPGERRRCRRHQRRDIPNNQIYVPGGLDVNGGALISVFELNLSRR